MKSIIVVSPWISYLYIYKAPPEQTTVVLYFYKPSSHYITSFVFVVCFFLFLFFFITVQNYVMKNKLLHPVILDLEFSMKTWEVLVWFGLVWFGLVLWYINHCRLLNAKSLYTYKLNIYDLVGLGFMAYQQLVATGVAVPPWATETVLSPWLAADEGRVSHMLSSVVW